MLTRCLLVAKEHILLLLLSDAESWNPAIKIKQQDQGNLVDILALDIMYICWLYDIFLLIHFINAKIRIIMQEEMIYSFMNLHQHQR